MENGTSNLLSQKKALAYATALALNIKGEDYDISNRQLILLTAAGTIFGTYVSGGESDTPDGKAVLGIGASADRLAGEPIDTILLKDAKLFLNGGVELSHEFLYVFASDIIGVSFGSLPEE
jgi:hypothetical protein